MAKAYSDDLCSKFLTAYETGNTGLKKLAATFQVSRAWAERILRTKRSTGSSSRPVGRPRGFPSRLTPQIRQRLCVQIDKQPDATINELREWLQTHESVAISQQRLCAVIFEIGLRVKKACTPASRIARKEFGGESNGEQIRPTSIRSGWCLSTRAA
jgi:transposase